MRAERPLPIDPCWSSAEEYVESLLSLVTSSVLLRNLCGGVHILDFLTRKPDLYTWVLPEEWRDWFDDVDIDDLLDLLFREDLRQFDDGAKQNGETGQQRSWRGSSPPPESLIHYIETIRLHSLDRRFVPVSNDIKPLPRRVGVGMKPKKAHEVANFAAYVDKLSSYVSEQTAEPLSVVDFGSGQNYLGRTLALPPYNRHVIAIERHHHNVQGARSMDVSVHLAKKKVVIRNKKEYRMRLNKTLENGLSTPPSEPAPTEIQPTLNASDKLPPEAAEEVSEVLLDPKDDVRAPTDPNKGSMTYIEHELRDGCLESILYPSSTQASDTIPESSLKASRPHPKSIAVSIHSCGNLTHHGLRSLMLNPSISAVAMIGCCYNLLTERLGPASYKLPSLRSNHPRLEATSNSFDPHGFPMSKKLENYEYKFRTDPDNDPSFSTTTATATATTANGSAAHNDHDDNISKSTTTTTTTTTDTNKPETHTEKGVRLNITARMMAVQAPGNWTPLESSSFFTRHFYRALLQKILLDRGVVKQALSPSHVSIPGGSLTGKDDTGTPLIIGSLRKSAFDSFENYCRAALEKLWKDPENGDRIREMTCDLLSSSPHPSSVTSSEHDQTPNSNPNLNANLNPETKTLHDYETEFAPAKKHLSVIWSLMAFSAVVIESLIVVDRWSWLKEQPATQECWVENVFGYDQSPRNLCVVGVKKKDVVKKEQEEEEKEEKGE